MNAIKATWTNGQILPAEPVDWPEGSELGGPATNAVGRGVVIRRYLLDTGIARTLLPDRRFDKCTCLPDSNL
jgi:hypothetical protein